MFGGLHHVEPPSAQLYSACLYHACSSEWSVVREGCVLLCSHTQDRKTSASDMTMCADSLNEYSMIG